jgi:hypothetical protein
MRTQSPPTVKVCTSFRLPHMASNTHVVGHAGCRGCDLLPVSCTSAGCGGLIHNEKWFDADADQYAQEVHFFEVGESECDRCGKIESRDEATVANVEAEWSKREEQHRRHEEQTRLETSPTPSEIVQAWISTVKGHVPRDRILGYFDIDESFQSVTVPTEAVEDEGSLDDLFPDIKRIVRPLHAAGDRQKLFFSPVKAQIFDAFESELARKPKSRLVRAAAIAFYWQLSNYIPGERMWGPAYDDDDRSEIEGTWWVQDDSPAYLSVRRLFAAILGVLASYGKVAEIVSWPEAQWEIRNAYAASDWSRVRSILDHVEREHLQTPLEISVLRFQFEGLLIIGPYIDILSPRLRANPDDIFYSLYLRGPLFNPLSLEHLNVEPEIFGLSAKLFQPEMCLIFLPLLYLAPPVIPLNSHSTIERLLADVQPHFSQLPDRGLIQRALAGLLYEAMGEQHQAAEQFLLLSTQYDDLHAEACSTLYKMKAVETLHQAGQTTRAIAKFRELRGLKEVECLNPVPLAKLAVSLGLLDEAKTIVSGLPEEAKEALDPVLRAALTHEDGEPFRKSEEKCRAWSVFAKLSSEAQRSWLWATFSLLVKQAAEPIQRESERIAIEQYGRTVELELAEVFLRFKDYGKAFHGKWKGDLLADPILKALLLQGSVMTLGQSHTTLQRIAGSGGTGEIDRLLQRFLREHYPGLPLRGHLEALGRLTAARNEACHRTTKVQPFQARAQAKQIIDAIHLGT